jgi:nitroreductase
MSSTTASTDVVRSAIWLACRAPSLHNSQPWQWIAENDTAQLFLDKDRILYSADHTGREAVIGCGAVLDHFRVAMAAQGWTAYVDRMPNPNNPLHLASVDFRPVELVTEAYRRRADAILMRRTDRLAFAEPPDWESIEHQLRRVAKSDAVCLDTIADDLRPDLAQASQLTESLRLYDTSYHTELRWWTGEFESSEGVPYSSLISASERDRVDLGRPFPVSHHSDRRSEFTRDHSKVLVLSTYDNHRSSVLQCGEVLSAVLLEATMAGLATCTLTHMTEIAASRDIVASLIGRQTTPQLLIRVGLAPQDEETPPATPRRPLEEVFHVR